MKSEGSNITDIFLEAQKEMNPDIWQFDVLLFSSN